MVGMGILLISFTVLSLFAIVWFKGRMLEQQMTTVLEKEAGHEIATLTRSINQRISGQYEIIQKKLISDLSVARGVLERVGGLKLDDAGKTAWKAVNQYDRQTRDVSLPQMIIGGQPVKISREMETRLPVVDEVSRLVGATCTIFQRMNSEGDMLRVLTNVPGKDGKRAIGTYIPRRNPDGAENPVVSTVLNGKTFYGRAFVVNQWYLTAYEPIKDSSGKVIGVLYVGLALEEQLAGLKKDLSEYVIGRTGYIYLLDSRGSYIVSKNNERNGENIWDARDSDGRYIIREIIQKVTARDDNGVEQFRYPWQNAGEDRPRYKLAMVSYFKSLDWVIGAGIYEDELNETTGYVNMAINSMLMWVLAAALLILLAGGLFSLVLTRRITGPILAITRQALMLSKGEVALEELGRQSMGGIERRKDELGRIGEAFVKLMEYFHLRSREADQISRGVLTLDVSVTSDRDILGLAFQKMTSDLNVALTGVKHSANLVASGSREINMSNQSLSDGASEQAASVEQITASIGRLVDNTRNTGDITNKAYLLMGEAKGAAEEGAQRMDELMTATSEINQSSKEIAKIIKTIDDIAFQTNLLALNAAVEAARAGKQGLGFAVVASSIRNLAGLSSKAAHDTAELIETSLKSIERETLAVDQTAEMLTDITQKVKQATFFMEEINTANQEQANSISEISQGLEQIETVTHKTASNAEESASAAGELARQAADVQRLMTSFQLRTNGFGAGGAAKDVPPAIDGIVFDPGSDHAGGKDGKKRP